MGQPFRRQKRETSKTQGRHTLADKLERYDRGLTMAACKRMISEVSSGSSIVLGRLTWPLRRRRPAAAQKAPALFPEHRAPLPQSQR